MDRGGDRGRQADGQSETGRAPLRLLNRDFLLLWQGQAVSGVGTSLSQIATIYWLLQATGSATTMGLVSMASALPGVLLGPIGGAIADRFSRRRLIIAGDCVLGLVMLLVGVAFFVIEDAVGLKVGCLVAAGVLSGMVNAFFRPAVMASIPNLVPMTRLNTANALNSFSMMTSMTVGQAVGGVLFRLLGAPVLFIVNGVTYLLSSLSEAFIRMPQKLPDTPPTLRSLMAAFGGDIVTGLRYVWGRAGLRNMVLAFAVLNFVTAPLAVLLPILLDVHRGLAADWYGYLMAAMALGNLGGVALAGAMRIDGTSRFVWGVGTLFAMAASTLVLGVAATPLFFLAANAVAGDLQRRDDDHLYDIDAVHHAGCAAWPGDERHDDGHGRHGADRYGTRGNRSGRGESERALAIHRCECGNGGGGAHHGVQPQLPGVPEHAGRGVGGRVGLAPLARSGGHI